MFCSCNFIWHECILHTLLFFSLPEQQSLLHTAHLSPRSPSLSVWLLNHLAPHLYISNIAFFEMQNSKLSFKITQKWEKGQGEPELELKSLSRGCRLFPGKSWKSLTFSTSTGLTASEYNASNWVLTSRGEIKTLPLNTSVKLLSCESNNFPTLKSFWDWSGWKEAVNVMDLLNAYPLIW